MSDGRDKDISKKFEDFHQELLLDVVHILNKRIRDFLVNNQCVEDERSCFIHNICKLIEQVCLNSFLYSCSSIYLRGIENPDNGSRLRRATYLSFMYIIKESAKDSIDEIFSEIQKYVNKYGIDGCIDVGFGLKEGGENE